MTLIPFIIICAIVYCFIKSKEWKSNNRENPIGTKMDYASANYDIATHGEDYYHKQNLSGKYDIPNDKIEL